MEEPVRRDRTAVWALVGVLVVGAGAVAVAFFLLGGEPPEAVPPSTSEAPSSSTTSTSATTSTSSTTTMPTTTTVGIDAAIVGSWSAVDADGSTIGVSFGQGAEFEAFDRASTTCGSSGSVQVPWSWIGQWAPQDVDLVAVEGSTTCYPIGVGTTPGSESVAFAFSYDRGADELEFMADGTRYERADGSIDGVWHRANGDSHEILFCASRSAEVECSYVLDLGSGNEATAEFVGAVVGDCTSFDVDLCERSLEVASGVAAYSLSDGTPVGSVEQLLIVQPDGQLAVEWSEVLSGFPDAPVPLHCPWYRTTADADGLPDECSLG